MFVNDGVKMSISRTMNEQNSKMANAPISVSNVLIFSTILMKLYKQSSGLLIIISHLCFKTNYLYVLVTEQWTSCRMYCNLNWQVNNDFFFTYLRIFFLHFCNFFYQKWQILSGRLTSKLINYWQIYKISWSVQFGQNT